MIRHAVERLIYKLETIAAVYSFELLMATIVLLPASALFGYISWQLWVAPLPAQAAYSAPITEEVETNLVLFLRHGGSLDAHGNWRPLPRDAYPN